MAGLPFDKEATAELPKTCGVYLFMDDKGKPLYVGKATDLRQRVRSYFGKTDHRLVTSLIHEKAKRMDFIVTTSAKEALILENSLIKKHGPLLNIRLKDDATYFSLRLDLSEEWPRLRIVRKRKKDDAIYFGPYPSAHACRKTIQYLTTLFPSRTCPDAVLYNRTRPCLSHEIGRCAAPCVGLIERPDYMKVLADLTEFLKGNKTDIIDDIEGQMHAAAEALEFERAAELRDRLKHIQRTLEQPLVSRRGGPDRDILGLYEAAGEVSLAILHVRDGSLAASNTYAFKSLGRSADEILGAFLGQFYGEKRQPAGEILLPEECADPELHREVLEEALGSAVTLRVPERGEGLRLAKLAERNAELSHRRRDEEADRGAAAIASLQDRLNLENVPDRIECFDVSHLGGEQVVASCVSFRDARPEKEKYRHYKLKEVQRNDDFAAMEEVLGRRLRRGIKEDDLPDLVVIDGGKPQLQRVHFVFQQMGVVDVDLIGLAKARGDKARTTMQRHERVWLPDAEAPIILEENAPETLLLARVRDEAHRFAITYQRRLRNKERIGSALEMVPGIGRRRSQALLERFGSVKVVRQATPEALTSVPGVTLELARGILEWFAANGREGSGADLAAESEPPFDPDLPGDQPSAS